MRGMRFGAPGNHVPLHYFPTNGQSLSLGTLDTAESITQPFRNKKAFSPSGTSYTTGAIPGDCVFVDLVTPLRPIVGPTNAFPDNCQGESVETSTVNQVTRLAIADGAGMQQWAADCFGQGGAPMSVIESPARGGTGNAFNSLVRGVQIARALAGDPSLFTCDFVGLIHGEADSQNQNASYYTQLLNLGSDLNSAICPITGQSLVAMLLSPPCSQPGAGAGFNYSALAMLKAAQLFPALFYLIGPKHQYAYADPQHLLHYPTLGDKIAQIIRIIQKTGTWAPTWPTNFSRASNVVTITFNVPFGALVFDSVQPGPHASGAWSLWGRTGFEAYDQVLPVSNCTLAGGTSGLVTVDTSPTPHGYTNSTIVGFNNIGGCNNINQTLWPINVISSTQFSLTGSNGNGAFIGTTNQVFVPIGITSAVISGNQVILTLARPPVGSTLQIGYSDFRDGTFGTGGAGFGSGGRCGLLRDSDPYTGNTGFANYNWTPEFVQNVP